MMQKTFSSLEITALSAFSDNYIWLIRLGNYAIVVDPGDANPVIEMLKQQSLTLSAILITHHHADHIDGVNNLIKYQDSLKTETNIYAPGSEIFNFPHVAVSNQDSIHIKGFEQIFKVISIPGHTLGHVAYYYKNNLFCGDTLFGCGCGRLFEGTPLQMYGSLQRLAALPIGTNVYCAHEYTLNNIKFALSIEPDNLDLRKRQLDTQKLRSQGLPSIPSSIDLELKTNPFLRCNQSAIQRNTNTLNQQEVSVFTKIRELRNNFGAAGD